MTFDETINSLRITLQQMARWGCAGFQCPPESLTTIQGWARPRAEKSNQRQPVEKAPHPIMAGHEAAATETLEQIGSDLGDCRRCRLSAGRTRIVFGQGNPQARLVFVGEAPGFEEDRSGSPFVGPAGQLLTKIIEAMKLTRDQVYICNVIKCRPPDNRDPEQDEIASCRPFLERQIAAINPEVICTLGSHAAHTLLDTNLPVSRLRGRFQAFNEIRVMPTYHPAYLLRHPERKRDVWEDMKKIMALLHIPL